MAGVGHGSVTGMDDRTLGRIDVILFDADYRDGTAALEDTWRVAVLASDSGALAARERARVAAVRAANERRDPAAARVRTSTAVHRALLGIAFALGTPSVALVATPRTGSVALQDAMLPAGVCAAVAVALLWWLEPRRANGSLWGSRVPAVIHLILGALWLLTAALVVLLRWGEIDGYRALPVTTGLTLLVCAGVAALFLWFRARQADRSGHQTGVARVTGDLLDQQDAPEVFAALDRWWAIAGPQAIRRDAARVRAVRTEVLARLRLAMLITERDERAASWAPVPATWAERT